MEAGVVFGRNILGYHLENGELTVNEEEAKLIKLIYRKYLDGMGATTIAKELENAGIKTKNGNDTWTLKAIYDILKNEKYAGDLLQKKTFTPDYLTHEKKYNRGEEEFVYIKDHHQPIIDREDFERVQEEMKRRTNTTEEQRHRYSNRYPFSGKIECGDCGSIYVGRQRKRTPEAIPKRYWSCGQNIKHGKVHALESGKTVGCNMFSVSDTFISNLTLQVISSIVEDKEKIKDNVLKGLNSVLNMFDLNQNDGTEDIEKQIKRIEEKKHQLIDLYFDNGISAVDLKSMNEKYDKEIERLQKQKTDAMLRGHQIKDKDQILKQAIKHIDNILSFDTFDDETYKNMLDKIVIRDRTNYDFYVKGILGESYFFAFKEPNLNTCADLKSAENPYISTNIEGGVPSDTTCQCL